MSTTYLLKSQTPNQVLQVASGNSYTADSSGFVSGVIPGDVLDLVQQGMIIIQTHSADGLTETPVPLTAFRNVTGAALAAAAATGSLGYTVTLGTAYFLVGEATSSSAKTNIAMAEITLPQNYVAGQNIKIRMNANYTGGGTVTGASCSLDLFAYPVNADGTMAADICATAAQLITATATDFDFTLTGTALAAGQRIVIKPVVLVTSASGANTGQLNSVRIV